MTLDQITSFQNFHNDLYQHFYDLKDTFILTTITCIASLVISNSLIHTFSIASASFFATRVIKKVILLAFGSDFLERFALVALRDANYVQYLAIAISIVTLWFFPIVAAISASVCGIYCGLTFEVHRAHDIQRSLR